MKKNIALIFVAIAMTTFFSSCSDDSSPTQPKEEETKDVNYFNNDIYSYTYDEYDLNGDNSKDVATEHQDSLQFVQILTKDGKSATEFQVYTNESGAYAPDGNVHYAGETNKLYIHSTVIQKLFGRVKANGFSLLSLLDINKSNWYLIADAKATSAWTLYEGTSTLNIEGMGSVDADVKITMEKSGTTTAKINEKDVTIDTYKLRISIKSETIVGEVNVDVVGGFWVAPNVGIVKSYVNSFIIPIANINVHGTESVLVGFQYFMPA